MWCVDSNKVFKMCVWAGGRMSGCKRMCIHRCVYLCVCVGVTGLLSWHQALCNASVTTSRTRGQVLPSTSLACSLLLLSPVYCCVEKHCKEMNTFTSSNVFSLFFIRLCFKFIPALSLSTVRHLRHFLCPTVNTLVWDKESKEVKQRENVISFFSNIVSLFLFSLSGLV